MEGEAWSAELMVPVASLRVAGTLAGERLDAFALSSADRAEIERRIRGTVLSADSRVVARATGESRVRGRAVVKLGDVTAPAAVRLRVVDVEAAGLCAEGDAEL